MDTQVRDFIAELVASRFHETYERLAPDYGYKTREASAVPWDEVPDENRALMIAVVSELLDRRVIKLGPSWPLPKVEAVGRGEDV